MPGFTTIGRLVEPAIRCRNIGCGPPRGRIHERDARLVALGGQTTGGIARAGCQLPGLSAVRRLIDVLIGMERTLWRHSSNPAILRIDKMRAIKAHLLRRKGGAQPARAAIAGAHHRHRRTLQGSNPGRGAIQEIAGTVRVQRYPAGCHIAPGLPTIARFEDRTLRQGPSVHLVKHAESCQRNGRFRRCCCRSHRSPPIPWSHRR